MPNEIYHRSEWGNPKAEGFGDVYFDPAATNKLYNHSDNYENSDGTDKILRDIPNKASIVLTPTAYSDGSLNTVIPPYQVLPTELVTNGDFSDGTTAWVKGLAASATQEVVNGALVMYAGSASDANNALSRTDTPQGYNGRKYKLELNRSSFVNGDIGYLRLDGAYDPNNIISFQEGTSTIYFTAYRDFTHIRFYAGSAEAGYTIDNVSLKEVQEADFDFSRGSSATRVNEKGLIEDVQTLSSNLVQNGDFEQIGSELVTNGNFDTDSDWTITAGEWDISNGKASIDSNVYSVLKQDVSLDGNLVVNVDLSEESGSGGFIIAARTFNNTYRELIRTSTATESYSETLTFYISDGIKTIEFWRKNPSSNAIGSIDNVSVKEVGQNWTFGDGWSMGDGVVSLNAPTGNLDQSLITSNGSKYRVTFTISNYVSGDVRWRFTGASNENGTLRSANGTYTEEITLTNSQSVFRFPATSGVMDIDNISVIEITDDTDIPRIDYTSGQGALLLEPQRQNKIAHHIPNSNWSIENNASITENYSTSPDGTQNASRVQLPSGSLARVYTQFTVDANQDSVSFYIKSNTGSNFNTALYLRDVGFGTVRYQNTNLEVTTEWQRVKIENQDLSAATVQVMVLFYNTSGSGDTQDFSLYGVQAEGGSYSTSIIPTSGSSVTRSADVANNSGNADLINSTEGVLYAEIAALANSGNKRRISLSDGTETNGVILALDAPDDRIKILIKSGGSTQANSQSAVVITATDFNKIAIKYKENDFALWVNGTEVFVDSSGLAPIGLNKLAFDFAGNSNFYGNVKSLAVFKEALTDAELQKLTS